MKILLLYEVVNIQITKSSSCRSERNYVIDNDRVTELCGRGNHLVYASQNSQKSNNEKSRWR